MTFDIELTDQPDTFMVRLYGKDHRTSLDTCDCEATRYGRLCIHRRFIFAMGGPEELRSYLLTEQRKNKHLNRIAPEKENTNEDQRSIPDQVPVG